MENPTRVLIIDTAWLGDVIFSTALIAAVKDLWPQSRLECVVAPRGEPLLRTHPNVEKLWVFDKRGRDRGWSGLQKFSAQLRQESYDLILNAHPSFRSRLLTRLINAPVSVGYRGFGSRFCFTHTVPNDLAVEPDHVKRRLALLAPVSPFTSQHAPACWTPGDGGSAARGSVLPSHVEGTLKVRVLPEEKQWAEQLLSGHAIPGTRLLGLIPGSAWETKRWPLGHFREIAKRWVEEQDGAVLVFGGPAEKGMIEELCRENERRILAVIGEPLTRVAALLSLCEAAVGNDTGVTFLAVAVGGPKVIALYGCTQVDYTFPPPHQALTAGVPCCLPRTGHGAHQCKWGKAPYCMSQITPDHVLAALKTRKSTDR